jgi:N-acetylneuraminic acid mutarotase
VDIYDLASGRITSGAPMPWPGADFAFAAWGKKIYLIGGVFGSSSQLRQASRTVIYDTVTDSWSVGPPMPSARKTRAAIVTRNSIIVLGGHHAPVVSAGVKAVEVFDLIEQRWFRLPDLAKSFSNHAAAVLEDTVFLFGNLDPTEEIAAYDLGTHTTAFFSDGTPTSQPTAVTLNGLVYVIGGKSGGEAMDEIQVFALSPATNP